MVFESSMPLGGGYRTISKKQLIEVLIYFVILSYTLAVVPWWPVQIIVLLGILILIWTLLKKFFGHEPKVFVQVTDSQLVVKNHLYKGKPAEEKTTFFLQPFAIGGLLHSKAFAAINFKDIESAKAVVEPEDLKEFSNEKKVNKVYGTLLKRYVDQGVFYFKRFFVCDDTSPIIELSVKQITFVCRTVPSEQKDYKNVKLYFSTKEPRKILGLIKNRV